MSEHSAAVRSSTLPLSFFLFLFFCCRGQNPRSVLKLGVFLLEGWNILQQCIKTVMLMAAALCLPAEQGQLMVCRSCVLAVTRRADDCRFPLTASETPSVVTSATPQHKVKGCGIKKAGFKEGERFTYSETPITVKHLGARTRESSRLFFELTMWEKMSLPPSFVSFVKHSSFTLSSSCTDISTPLSPEEQSSFTALFSRLVKRSHGAWCFIWVSVKQECVGKIALTQ